MRVYKQAKKQAYEAEECIGCEKPAWSCTDTPKLKHEGRTRSMQALMPPL